MLADNFTLLDFAVLAKVLFQLFLGDIMRQAADEDLFDFFLVDFGIGIDFGQCVFALDLGKDGLLLCRRFLVCGLAP